MLTMGNVIAATASLTPAYAERLISGIKPETFASFARPGGTLVKSNHPAFVFGHLNLYPARVLALLGRPAGDAQPPATWDGLFKAGVDCVDDPSGKTYPPMKELTEFFFKAYTMAIAAVRDARDEQLVAPNPTEGRARELFPTIGAALGFYISGHPQMHFGQVSAWRRMMGLPAAT